MEQRDPVVDCFTQGNRSRLVLLVLKDPFETLDALHLGFAGSSVLMVCLYLTLEVLSQESWSVVQSVVVWVEAAGVVGVWRYASRPWHGPSAAERLGKGLQSDSFSFHNYCAWDYKAHFLKS